MKTVNQAFLECKSRLELTETEKKDAKRRQEEVREVLRAEFDVARYFLTGSYSRHTKTKPLKDVDIFFVLGEKEAGRRKEAPSKTLDAFEACLEKKYGGSNVERGRRCITVTFDKRLQVDHEDGKVLSVDAVPAFAKGDDYEIPDDIQGEWIKTNPEVHSERGTRKNAELSGQWKPLVKMLKGWNREAGKPIKPSFLIEVMAIDLIDAPAGAYAQEVRSFFAAAREGLDSDWPDPAGLGPPVSDQMDASRTAEAKAALRDAEKTAARAMWAEQTGRGGEALALWRQLLGRYFPTR